jgi:hypothetical protein
MSFFNTEGTARSGVNVLHTHVNASPITSRSAKLHTDPIMWRPMYVDASVSPIHGVGPAKQILDISTPSTSNAAKVPAFGAFRMKRPEKDARKRTGKPHIFDSYAAQVPKEIVAA